MDQLLDSFLAYITVEKGLSKNTLESYGRDVRKFLTFLEEGQTKTVQDIKYENIPWTLDDGSPPPRKKYFINDHFDLDGKCFTGEIDWSGNPFGGAKRWVYEMIFSED